MPREDELGEAKLKALGDRVMDAYGELDDRLGKRHFPVTENASGILHHVAVGLSGCR